MQLLTLSNCLSLSDNSRTHHYQHFTNAIKLTIILILLIHGQYINYHNRPRYILVKAAELSINDNNNNKNDLNGVQHTLNVREILRAEPLASCGRRPGFQLHGSRKAYTNARRLQQQQQRTSNLTASKRLLMISNGSSSRYGQFPSYGQLKGLNDMGTTTCGAILIGPWTILSAVHCLYNFASMDEFVVELGLNGPAQFKKDYKIAKICHEHNHCLKEISKFNANLPIKDFAIFELANQVEYNDFVQPVCLSYNSSSDYRSNDSDEFEAIGLGWYNNWGDRPKNLMLTPMKRNCDQSIIDDYRNLLAPYVDCYKSVNEANLCEGDSGGPMYYYRRVQGESRQFLAALTSFGTHDCRSISYPVGYTNIEAYEDKISEILHKQTDTTTTTTTTTTCYNMIINNPRKPLECKSLTTQENSTTTTPKP